MQLAIATPTHIAARILTDFSSPRGPRWVKPCIVLILIVVWLLIVAVACHAADAPPPMPSADTPPSPVAVLTLNAPKSVPAGSGYLKIRATAASAVSFDVEAQFEDAEAPFQFEQLDPLTLLVSVPASAGVIRVEAAVNVEGKAPIFAKAFIEVVAKKNPPVSPTPPTPVQPPGPPVGKLFTVFVVAKGDVLANSPTLKKSIEELGDTRSVLDPASPAIAAQGLAKFLADAGGAPALILMDAAGDVHKAVKLPADEAGVVSLIKDTHAGK